MSTLHEIYGSTGTGAGYLPPMPLMTREERMSHLFQDLMTKVESICLDVLESSRECYEAAQPKLDQIRQCGPKQLRDCMALLADLKKHVEKYAGDPSEHQQDLKLAVSRLQGVYAEMEYVADQYVPQVPTPPGVPPMPKEDWMALNAPQGQDILNQYKDPIDQAPAPGAEGGATSNDPTSNGASNPAAAIRTGDPAAIQQAADAAAPGGQADAGAGADGGLDLNAVDPEDGEGEGKGDWAVAVLQGQEPDMGPDASAEGQEGEEDGDAGAGGDDPSDAGGDEPVGDPGEGDGVGSARGPGEAPFPGRFGDGASLDADTGSSVHSDSPGGAVSGPVDGEPGGVEDAGADGVVTDTAGDDSWYDDEMGQRFDTHKRELAGEPEPTSDPSQSTNGPGGAGGGLITMDDILAAAQALKSANGAQQGQEEAPAEEGGEGAQAPAKAPSKSPASDKTPGNFEKDALKAKAKRKPGQTMRGQPTLGESFQPDDPVFKPGDRVVALPVTAGLGGPDIAARTGQTGTVTKFFPTNRRVNVRFADGPVVTTVRSRWLKLAETISLFPGSRFRVGGQSWEVKSKHSGHVLAVPVGGGEEQSFEMRDIENKMRLGEAVLAPDAIYEAVRADIEKDLRGAGVIFKSVVEISPSYFIVKVHSDAEAKRLEAWAKGRPEFQSIYSEMDLRYNDEWNVTLRMAPSGNSAMAKSLAKLQKSQYGRQLAAINSLDESAPIPGNDYIGPDGKTYTVTSIGVLNDVYVCPVVSHEPAVPGSRGVRRQLGDDRKVSYDEFRRYYKPKLTEKFFGTMKAGELFKKLLKAGWEAVRQVGSHITMKKPGMNPITFAFHKGVEIGGALLSKIVKQTGLVLEGVGADADPVKTAIGWIEQGSALDHASIAYQARRAGRAGAKEILKRLETALDTVLADMIAIKTNREGDYTKEDFEDAKEWKGELFASWFAVQKAAGETPRTLSKWSPLLQKLDKLQGFLEAKARKRNRLAKIWTVMGEQEKAQIKTLFAKIWTVMGEQEKAQIKALLAKGDTAGADAIDHGHKLTETDRPTDIGLDEITPENPEDAAMRIAALSPTTIGLDIETPGGSAGQPDFNMPSGVPYDVPVCYDDIDPCLNLLDPTTGEVELIDACEVMNEAEQAHMHLGEVLTTLLQRHNPDIVEASYDIAQEGAGYVTRVYARFEEAAKKSDVSVSGVTKDLKWLGFSASADGYKLSTVKLPTGKAAVGLVSADKPDFARQVLHSLQGLGYKVTTAPDGGLIIMSESKAPLFHGTAIVGLSEEGAHFGLRCVPLVAGPGLDEALAEATYHSLLPTFDRSAAGVSWATATAVRDVCEATRARRLGEGETAIIEALATLRGALALHERVDCPASHISVGYDGAYRYFFEWAHGGDVYRSAPVRVDVMEGKLYLDESSLLGSDADVAEALVLTAKPITEGWLPPGAMQTDRATTSFAYPTRMGAVRVPTAGGFTMVEARGDVLSRVAKLRERVLGPQNLPTIHRGDVVEGDRRRYEVVGLPSTAGEPVLLREVGSGAGLDEMRLRAVTPGKLRRWVVESLVK